MKFDPTPLHPTSLQTVSFTPRSRKQSLRRMIQTIAAVSTVTVLTGCAVKPEAMTETVVATGIEHDLSILEQTPQQIEGAVDLKLAIARAVKYNREQRVKVMEAALSQRQLEVSRYDMLPAMTASAGYQRRDSYAASASTTFVNGSPEPLAAAPTYSVSQDKIRNNSDVAFTWSILDFGLSYVRAGQQADRYMIAQERKRKVTHNIIEQVRGAYWRAVSADRLLKQIKPLLVRVQEALDDSQQIEQLRIKSPIEALTYQRELLDSIRSLRKLQRDMVMARIELATLMGLRPGQHYTLADSSLQVPEIKVELAKMEQLALQYRPELMESRYQSRISQEETKAALLGMLPGISLNAGVHYDDSDYILNNDWIDYGSQVSWNLFNVFKGPAARKVAEAQGELAKEQRLALSMAVISQVHIANVSFAQSRKEYEVAERYLDVTRRIDAQIKASSQTQRTGKLQMIREELNSVLAELRRDVAYADLQNSYGRIFSSIGLDPLPEQIANDSVDALAEAVEVRFKAWSSGEIEKLLPSSATKSVAPESADQAAAEVVSEVAVKSEAPVDIATEAEVGITETTDHKMVAENHASLKWWEM